MKHSEKQKLFLNPIAIPAMLQATFILGLAIGLVSCNQQLDPSKPRTITFALTNDIHGRLEPETDSTGQARGGLAYYAKLIGDLRKDERFTGDYNSLVVLDSGDQFQGTLLSNYDEGETVFKAMNQIGYDAVVPGNHDYDFGPLGWLHDKVSTGETSANPREAIENLAKLASFPLLSANTYLKSTISPKGVYYPVELDSQCRPLNETLSVPLDFENAARPNFLRPYTLITRAGVRIALIGIDHQNTASMTTAENVSDLCFRDEIDSYVEIRKSLEGKADVFVMLIHGGNTPSTQDASNITYQINSRFLNTTGVHLVAAGHTHYVHNDRVGNTPVVQNGAHAENFGLVRLTFDPNKREVLHQETVSYAGVPLYHDRCETGFTEACKSVSYPLTAENVTQGFINDLKKLIAPMTSKVLAQVSETVTRGRIDENALSNILSDSLRKSVGAELGIMNMGGIRTNLEVGALTYEKFFEVLPFNNQAVLIKELKWSTLKKLISKSIQSCGRFGALALSGVKYKFSRSCLQGKDVDVNAKLLFVETEKGEVLYDAKNNFEVGENISFGVATLDFLAQGGSAYSAFLEATVTKTLGIARELIATELSQTVPNLNNSLDQRSIQLEQ